jgi:hypothetical protein
MAEVYEWTAWTDYKPNDIVVYKDIRYKIVQPHKSEPNWTPDVTPALWSRLPVEAHKRVIVEKDWHEHDVQQVDIHQEEQQKHWYDLDAKRKKELEIGGGLAAGLGLLAGGYFAYQHHKKTEEEKKAIVWSLQSWLTEAQARTAKFHERGVTAGEITWVLVHGTNIPREAIPGGEENGNILYISRAFQDGGIHPGKAGRHLDKGASIAYSGEEITLDTYEVLVGDSGCTQWVESSSTLTVESLSAKVVEGGRDKDGTSLYIAQAIVEGSVHCGKAGGNISGASISYGGSETIVERYNVLCYN